MAALKAKDVIEMVEMLIKNTEIVLWFIVTMKVKNNFSHFDKVEVEKHEGEECFVITNFPKKEMDAYRFIQVLNQLVEEFGDRYVLSPDVYDIEGNTTINEIKKMHSNNQTLFCLK